MEAIKIVNYVIMVLFFACYAYQFLYIPIALLKKKKPLPVLQHRQRRGTKILRSVIPLLILPQVQEKRYIFLICFTPAQRTG